MRRWLIFILPVAVIILVMAGLYYQTANYSQVSVELDAGAKGEIVQQGDKAKTVASFESSYKSKLKQGSYLLTAKASNDFEEETTSFSVSDQPVTLKLSRDYSRAKLNQLLALERPLIDQAYLAAFPSVAPKYSLTNPLLFKRGEWFGAVLTPADSSQDSLRIILQKKDGKWVVVTDPPPLTASSVIYPDIPKDVVRAVNTL